jgi:hypothetical protein
MVSARAEEVFVGRTGMWEGPVGVMREGGSGRGGSGGGDGGWSGVGLEGKIGRLGDTGSPHFFALLSAAKPLSAALTVTAFGLEMSSPPTRAII